MIHRAVEISPQVYARVGGWLYLVVFVAGIFADGFVGGRLVVPGDAAATAHNIMASLLLWRLGFTADVLMVVCYVAVTLILYVLLRPVNRDIALLAAFFSLTGCAILGIDVLAYFAPSILLGGADYLNGLDAHQLQALAMLALKLYGYGYDISIVFFAFYCLSIGFLIFRSGYLPKTLGVLLAIGALSYLIKTSTHFLAPSFAGTLFMAPGGVAELALTLWLIIKGVNVPKWEERANRMVS
jgi:hypothetical protein